MDASQWEPIADRIAAAHPGAGFDEAARARYLEALAPLPADAVSEAVDDLLLEPRPGPPSAAVIRQAVRGAREPGPQGAWLDAADTARRTYFPALALLSSAVTVLALAGIAIWWLWSGG